MTPTLAELRRLHALAMTPTTETNPDAVYDARRYCMAAFPSLLTRAEMLEEAVRLLRRCAPIGGSLAIDIRDFLARVEELTRG